MRKSIRTALEMPPRKNGFPSARALFCGIWLIVMVIGAVVVSHAVADKVALYEGDLTALSIVTS